MGTINTRLARLEQQQGTDDRRRRQIETDAAAFRAKIASMSAAATKDSVVVDLEIARARVAEFFERFRAETAHLS